MKQGMLILIVAALSCCLAAPTIGQDGATSPGFPQLKRPSPINPEVPGDPKPTETITKITDPKEIVKHKRETATTTVLPAFPSILRVDHKVPSPTVPTEQHLQRSNEQVTAEHLPLPPAPAVAVHPLPGILPEVSSSTVQRRKIPPTLDHALHTDSVSSPPHTDAKRDIPVPLVAKHPHPEESTKEDEKKDFHVQQSDSKHIEESKEGDNPQVASPHQQKPEQQAANPLPSHHLLQHPHDFHPAHPHVEHKASATLIHSPTAASPATTEHPVIRHHPVPVAELFARPKHHPEAGAPPASPQAAAPKTE